MRYYEEITLICPYDGIEVYGQDGYGWYTYQEDIEIDPDLFASFGQVPSKNPLFTNLVGATKAKLKRRDLIELKND